MINKARQAVAGGGLAIFIPVVIAYATAGQFLPVRVLSQFSFSCTLISTLVILWLYRRTVIATIREKVDIGFMWFAIGFAGLMADTVVNVTYGTWNYFWKISIVSGSSMFLTGVRFGYVLCFWAFIVSKMTAIDAERVPPRGWGTIVGIIFAGLLVTAAIIWWRGEM